MKRYEPVQPAAPHSDGAAIPFPMTLSPFLDLVPMLICADVQASVRFYVDVLGFEVIDRMDDVGATGFASLRNGPAQIMLASPTYIPRAPRVEGRYPQSAYYFYVEDADALRAAVVDAGWPATECVDRFYGLREFEMVDPEGHVLLFGQDIGPVQKGGHGGQEGLAT